MESYVYDELLTADEDTIYRAHEFRTNKLRCNETLDDIPSEISRIPLQALNIQHLPTQHDLPPSKHSTIYRSDPQYNQEIHKQTCAPLGFEGDGGDAHGYFADTTLEFLDSSFDSALNWMCPQNSADHSSFTSPAFDIPSISVANSVLHSPAALSPFTPNSNHSGHSNRSNQSDQVYNISPISLSLLSSVHSRSFLIRMYRSNGHCRGWQQVGFTWTDSSDAREMRLGRRKLLHFQALRGNVSLRLRIVPLFEDYPDCLCFGSDAKPALTSQEATLSLNESEHIHHERGSTTDLPTGKTILLLPTQPAKRPTVLSKRRYCEPPRPSYYLEVEDKETEQLILRWQITVFGSKYESMTRNNRLIPSPSTASLRCDFGAVWYVGTHMQ